MIDGKLVEDVTVELLRKAAVYLPHDVKAALERSYDDEKDDTAKAQLKTILENIALAGEKGLPMCQDTGVHLFYVDLCGIRDSATISGSEASRHVGKHNVSWITDAIAQGVRRATREVPLRPNTVNPLTRENPGDNTGMHMPHINFRTSDNDYLEITVMMKGAGSENMSCMRMLTPSQGVAGIKEFVLESLVSAGGNPCPPVILGIGIGGSADICTCLAKEALLRPLGTHHHDEKIALLERELYDALKDIGIGPMGLGGRTTLLGVHVEYADCHTASLPVAVNFQCWAARRATARIYEDGRVEYPSHDGGK